MKKLQRYNLADYAMGWVKDDDGEVCMDYDVERLEANNAELLEAAEIQQQCGMPVKATFWDAEGIEGWRWSHPDGRVWEVVSDWNEPIPIHPMMAAAIAKAKEGNPS